MALRVRSLCSSLQGALAFLPLHTNGLLLGVGLGVTAQYVLNRMCKLRVGARLVLVFV